MNSSVSYAVPEFSYTTVESAPSLDMNGLVPNLAAASRAVEEVLQYKFKRVGLLEEALTHPSYTESASYERLEFIGDAALGLAVSNYVFLTYPNIDQGQLSLLRAANISTEKLARAAIKHGLHRYIRHNAAQLHEKVSDFAKSVEEECETEVYGGVIRAPKILADIVESVAAAVYVDCGFDLKSSWPIFERLLEPLVTLDLLQQQPQQKEITGSASAKQKENPKLHAAKDALQKLTHNISSKIISVDYYSELNDSSEIYDAKYKLHEICGKKEWQEPIYSYAAPGFSYTTLESAPLSLHRDMNDLVPEWAAALRAVEKVLQYKFKRMELLEEALTHSSYANFTCYERLEFIGDSALGLAVANYVFLNYPNLDQGQLSLLRAANVSTEKLARAAIKHGLHRYIRHNAAILHEKVSNFAKAVEEEGETEVYGGACRAPKILADIVESVAAAVYVDIGFDLKALWLIFERLLEPLVTLDLLQQQPQPVTMLFQLCQKDGKQVNIKYLKERGDNVACVFVNGELIGSASAKQKGNAKLHAAKNALQKLTHNIGGKIINVDYYSELNDSCEIEGAKHKLLKICGKKKWPKPIYRIEEEKGPAHDKRFICSVLVETATTQLSAKGEKRSRIKYAENSAATTIILGLLQSKYI